MTSEVKKSQKKVIVVEDDDDIRALYHEILTGEGFDVDVAANGEEALKILHANGSKTCLLLTDFMMPGMNGSELVKLMKENDTLITLPVVMISAKPLQGSEVEGVDFLKKPIDVDTIIAKVKEYCGPAEESCIPWEKKIEKLEHEKINPHA